MVNKSNSSFNQVFSNLDIHHLIPIEINSTGLSSYRVVPETRSIRQPKRKEPERSTLIVSPLGFLGLQPSCYAILLECRNNKPDIENR